MKNFFLRLLQSFEYNTVDEWLYSLFPSAKYELTYLVASLSLLAGGIEFLFGFGSFSAIALFIAMIFETASGIKASAIRKEDFSSAKLSRFTFKTAGYFIVIAISHLFAQDKLAAGDLAAGMAFKLMYHYLVFHVVGEYVTSILENLAVIDGKKKTYLIKKITSKIQSLFP